MANYWAITIGINQYRHLQPLMHAQNDALFMHRFFTETAGIPAGNCVLLSDLATSVGHQVVYPDKPAVSEWVATITQRVNADDVLWFFFSGYGVQLEGSDYLMPIDGDPGQIKETGLAISDLVETLAQLPTNKTLLVLDINRSQGSFAGQAIGRQVISLAEADGLPLLLSCEPEQYSHETFGVRHGLFTAALLEALQQDCSTLDAISQYVSKRLPELCEHHWRPIQNPVTILSDARRETVVVPENQMATDVDSQVVLTENSVDSAASAGSGVTAEKAAAATVLAGAGGTLIASSGANGAIADEPALNGTVANGTGRSNRETAGSAGYEGGKKTVRNSSNESALAIADKNGALVSSTKTSAESAISGAKLRNWGLAALALLMIGVLLKQPFMRTAWTGLSDRVAALAGRSPGENADEVTEDEIADASTESVDGGVGIDGAVEVLPPGTDEAAESAPDESDVTEPETAEPETADESATPENSASEESASEESAEESAETAAAGTNADSAGEPVAVAETTSAETKALLARANTALEQRQFSDALIALQQVPKDERDSTFASVLTQARAGVSEAKQYNASVLTDARTSIQPTQASQFANAIAKARLIKPGEPYYEEAQQDIRSWSQIILDIAEGRATSGNLDGAIAAANVMPYDNDDFHQKADERIAFWQQRQNSREIIVAAQAIPRSGQASTYQQGIVKLREVPIEHPEYETAQRLADEWSARIFSIAQARAAQGRPGAAVQAAVLVPAGTTSYESTQQAIKRWRSEE